MYGNLRTPKRNHLPSLIPIPTPYMIRVDPCNACNFRCQYCPTAFPDLLNEVGRPKGMMPLEVFTKIIDDLRAFPNPLKKLYVYKDGEPLLHKKFPEMIAYAKSAGIADEIWTTTNGSQLKPELNRKLADCGLHSILISIQGISSAAYLEIAKVKLDYEQLKENIGDLYHHRKNVRVYVKTIDFRMTDADRQKFLDDFSPICDLIHIDKPMGWSASSVRDFTLGTNPATNVEGGALAPKSVCPFPFYTLSVNVDGTVSVCCADWSHATVIGDTKKNSLLEIWTGPALREFRIMHLRGLRAQNKACGDCQYIQTVPDNLDADAPELLQRLGATPA